jgi:uncharacterized protein YbaR (Trm112 family)
MDDDLITDGLVEEESIESDEQAKITEAIQRWYRIIDGMD